MGLKHHAAPQFFWGFEAKFGARFRRSRHALVETVPGRPGTPKQVVREGSTLRFRLERIGYLNIASICSRKHEWGLNTMPHPNFLGF